MKTNKKNEKTTLYLEYFFKYNGEIHDGHGYLYTFRPDPNNDKQIETLCACVEFGISPEEFEEKYNINDFEFEKTFYSVKSGRPFGTTKEKTVCYHRRIFPEFVPKMDKTLKILKKRKEENDRIFSDFSKKMTDFLFSSALSNAVTDDWRRKEEELESLQSLSAECIRHPNINKIADVYYRTQNLCDYLLFKNPDFIELGNLAEELNNYIDEDGDIYFTNNRKLL